MTKIGQRDVIQHDQRDELLERADAVFADRVADRAENAERRDAHDQPHDAEQHAGDGVDQRRDLLGLFAADQSERDAEQHGEEQHLQHVVARQRVERRGRNDVEDEAADAGALQLVGVVGVGAERFRVERRSVDVHAVAGAERESEHDAEHERDGGHHLEINQRLDADAADFLEVAGAGNAVHHDAEHDRRHDHRDELEEGVAEDFQADGEVRRQDPERDAQEQCDQHLDEQRFEDRCRPAPGRCSRCGRNGGGCHRGFLGLWPSETCLFKQRPCHGQAIARLNESGLGDGVLPQIDAFQSKRRRSTLRTAHPG